MIMQFFHPPRAHKRTNLPYSFSKFHQQLEGEMDFGAQVRALGQRRKLRGAEVGRNDGGVHTAGVNFAGSEEDKSRINSVEIRVQPKQSSYVRRIQSRLYPDLRYLASVAAPGLTKVLKQDRHICETIQKMKLPESSSALEPSDAVHDSGFPQSSRSASEVEASDEMALEDEEAAKFQSEGAMPDI